MLKNKMVLIVTLVLFSLIFVNTSYAIIEEKVDDENIFQNTPAVIIKDNGIINSDEGMDEMSSGRIQNVVVEVLSGEKRGCKYNATYTVMAKEGYEVSRVLVNGSEVKLDDTNSFVIESANSDVNIVVEYSNFSRLVFPTISPLSMSFTTATAKSFLLKMAKILCDFFTFSNV